MTRLRIRAIVLATSLVLVAVLFAAQNGWVREGLGWRIAAAMAALFVLAIEIGLRCSSKKPVVFSRPFFLGAAVAGVGLGVLTLHVWTKRPDFVPGLGLNLAGPFLFFDFGQGFTRRCCVKSRELGTVAGTVLGVAGIGLCMMSLASRTGPIGPPWIVSPIVFSAGLFTAVGAASAARDNTVAERGEPARHG